MDDVGVSERFAAVADAVSERFIAALQWALGQEEIEPFLVALRRVDGIIAGSFPLFFVFKPPDRLSDMHPDTKREVMALLLCARRLGYDLPQTCLEVVAPLLQSAGFLKDLDAESVDIDLFVASDICPTIESFQSDEEPQHLGLGRGWQIVDDRAEAGAYALFPGVYVSKVFVHAQAPLRLNVIYLSGRYPRPVDFLQLNFDFDFCQVWFDASSRRLTAPDSAVCGMRGTMRLSKYESIAVNIRMRALARVPFDMELLGLNISDWQRTLSALLSNVERRAKKYNRRRFRIDNMEAVRAFTRQQTEAAWP